MRHLLYAVVATSLAMLATSGIVVLATAATGRPDRGVVNDASRDLADEIDTAIARQLVAVRARLQVRPGSIQ